jgi:hypothetical protein
MPTPTEDTIMGTVHSLDAHRLALDERNRLRDRAMVEADALRSQAMSEFFCDAGAWLGHRVDHTLRAANRFAARLHQHAKRRAASRPSGSFEF